MGLPFSSRGCSGDSEAGNPCSFQSGRTSIAAALGVLYQSCLTDGLGQRRNILTLEKCYAELSACDNGIAIWRQERVGA
jgi:hypothetical protein